ncbi:MAG: tyrosine-type recombinase/integrase [Eubacteriales bacterium]|nr:tyrosine-type recombinase/integrase [Eubacteriales bacterium]
MDDKELSGQVSKYLEYCKIQKGLSPKTVKAYGIDLRQFTEFFLMHQHLLDRECIQNFIGELHRKYKVKSVKRKIASLKAFLNYLEFEEIINVNPFSKLRIKLHEPFLLPRTIPLSSVDTLLKCVYAAKATLTAGSYRYNTVLRDIAVLELLFATGMRVSELCSLGADDIGVTDGTIKIFGKGAKERIIQVGHVNVLTAVSEYSSAFADKIEATGHFFINRLGRQLSDQSVRNMITRYTDQAHIEQHITPHMFRHSFATLLLEEDVDIRYIQQLLGHSSITTTQIYTHVSSKKQREILAAKHPRNKICV